MWIGVVNVICMLHWCSNSSLNASSAGKDCDCMVGEQKSVSDDISLGPLYYPGWDAWFCTIKTSLSLYIHLSPTPPSALRVRVCMCKFLNPASVALYGSDMLSTSYYSHKKRSVSCLMQFKAVEVMPQITLCSLAWHAPTQPHPRPAWVAAKGPVCLSYVHKMTGVEARREDRRQERSRNRKKDERKGGRKTVIRSRKCLNCKWVNVTLTAEKPDRHMMELSSLLAQCHWPVKQRVWDIFCHFTSNFLGIGGYKIREKAEGNTPALQSFSLSLSFYHTHN